ncbi:MAG: VanZ family protein [Planctomycetota bacterium]
MILVRLTCAVYWLVLSVLLLAPDPMALFGIDQLPGPPGGRMVHFFLFTLLAFLVWASRWPARRRRIVGLLLVFAVVMELLQVFVPERTVEVLDLIENLLGVAAGTAIWRWVHKKLPRLSPEK